MSCKRGNQANKCLVVNFKFEVYIRYILDVELFRAKAKLYKNIIFMESLILAQS